MKWMMIASLFCGPNAHGDEWPDCSVLVTSPLQLYDTQEDCVAHAGLMIAQVAKAKSYKDITAAYTCVEVHTSSW